MAEKSEIKNSRDYLIIKGAREHNLKNIDLQIPKDTLTVITGLSGSGKSSLAFDTIYAEGQRRYVESLSAYARQFLGMMQKPDVDYIQGLSPAISIDQKSASHNPRSTVGTVTEIYDYLRLLYARGGHPRCPNDGTLLKSQTVQEIVDSILDVKEETKVMVLGPVVKNRKGTYEELFSRFLAQGFVRARVDGNVYSLEEDINLDRYVKHNIEIVVDRLVIKTDSKNDNEFAKRLTDSVESALNLGDGEVIVAREIGEKWEDSLYSEKLVCPIDGTSFPKVEPHTFSFNSPYGACEFCHGLGYIQEIDPELVFNPRLTISEGGIYPWSRMADNTDSWYMQVVKALADDEGFSLRTPLGELSEKHRHLLLYGSGDKKYKINYSFHDGNGSRSYNNAFEGVIPNLLRRYQQTESDFIKKEIEKFMRNNPCPECGGKKLKKEALAVTILNKNIVDVTDLSIEDLLNWISLLSDENHSTKADDGLSNQEIAIVKQVVKEINARLNFLVSVGLDYLTLSRRARTLSGGEAQRIRLASQIGSGLTGVLYVLDEPSIGLHQRDNDRLLATLRNLKELGNTVLVVEHDEDTIRNADFIVDIGPGAGEHGGQVIGAGNLQDILNNPKSMTGEYLSGKRKIDKKEILKRVAQIAKSKGDNTNKGNIKIIGARGNNLKNLTVNIPLGKLVAVTGVSGSGKSTLINDTFYKKVARELYGSKALPSKHDAIEGLENVDKAINIDQSPIGRTPRSNPATYVGLFTPIRELFAKTKEARARGYKPGRFSFNVKGGRCENCRGDGVIKIEMQFLPDVYVECEVCGGQRYNREALQIDYKGKTIADVLNMTVEEGYKFFENIPSIAEKLRTLDQVGLGYIKLGQQANTLSGGEAQRIKLSTELSKRSTGKTLYILDEPTTGLHFEDVRKLLIVLHSLVYRGNSVLVIEHNLDVIKTADWIIDLGPEGGEKGGEIIAEGTVDDIKKNKKSYTGEWLKKIS